MHQYFRHIFLVFVSFQTLAVSAATTQRAILSGMEIMTEKKIEVKADSKKALVVVFLSAVCPCSNSHTKELAALAQQYKGFEFVGVHSNTDESKELTKSYFEQAKLPFPIIQDSGAMIADQYKALKTPHVFVIKQNGEVVYQGGVSSSRNFDSADKKFLREALEDVQNNRSVRVPEGRTLGCVISRGE